MKCEFASCLLRDDDRLNVFGALEARRRVRKGHVTCVNIQLWHTCMQVTCDGAAGQDDLVVLSRGRRMTGESRNCPVTMGTTWQHLRNAADVGAPVSSRMMKVKPEP